jgi:hypothetical protein
VASNLSTRLIPVVPVARASKNAVFPSPIELTTPTPVMKTRDTEVPLLIPRASFSEQRERGDPRRVPFTKFIAWLNHLSGA